MGTSVVHRVARLEDWNLPLTAVLPARNCDAFNSGSMKSGLKMLLLVTVLIAFAGVAGVKLVRRGSVQASVPLIGVCTRTFV